jgi:hypothetical protein
MSEFFASSLAHCGFKRLRSTLTEWSLKKQQVALRLATAAISVAKIASLGYSAQNMAVVAAGQ